MIYPGCRSAGHPAGPRLILIDSAMCVSVRPECLPGLVSLVAAFAIAPDVDQVHPQRNVRAFTSGASRSVATEKGVERSNDSFIWRSIVNEEYSIDCDGAHTY